MIATLPYVNKEKIGVTGHSNGALASRTAVLLDNEAEEPLIMKLLFWFPMMLFIKVRTALILICLERRCRYCCMSV